MFQCAVCTHYEFFPFGFTCSQRNEAIFFFVGRFLLKFCHFQFFMCLKFGHFFVFLCVYHSADFFFFFLMILSSSGIGSGIGAPEILVTALKREGQTS